jgi:hypothetical protein
VIKNNNSEKKMPVKKKTSVSDFRPPSNPDDIRKIKNSLAEIAAQEVMKKDRAAAIKEIKDELEADYNMPKTLINWLVSSIDDNDYIEKTTENSVFELARETILGDAGLPDDNE